MSICSPGSACIVSLRGTEPDLGPVTMTSTGTNHGCGPLVLQGQSRARGSAGLMASYGNGLFWAGVRRQWRSSGWAQGMAGLKAVVAQACGSDCWGSTDSGVGLDQGTEALGKGGSGSSDSAGDWWLWPSGAWGMLRARRLSVRAALEGM